jgi:hypothetical protein
MAAERSESVLLRPEVLACQERAEALRVEADEVTDAAAFWASLRTDCCADDDPACADPRCYRTWREYPDG